jgi:hypothetical protein
LRDWRSGSAARLHRVGREFESLIPYHFIEVSSSGRTAGFDPAYRGSNPCTSTIIGGNMQTEKSEFQKAFEKSVEEIKQEQKEAQEASKPVQYDSWQIEMMHWGAHH